MIALFNETPRQFSPGLQQPRTVCRVASITVGVGSHRSSSVMITGMRQAGRAYRIMETGRHPPFQTLSLGRMDIIRIIEITDTGRLKEELRKEGWFPTMPSTDGGTMATACFVSPMPGSTPTSAPTSNALPSMTLTCWSP